MTYLIIILSLLFIFLAIKRLELAVQLLIFALPAYLIRFNIGPLPTTVLEVMIWIVFLVWLSKSYRQIIENLKLKFSKNWKLSPPWRDPASAGEIGNWKLIEYPFGVELILAVIIAFIAAGISGFSSASLGIWKAYFFDPALLYIVVLNVFGNGFKLPKLLWPLAFSALAVSLVAIYQKFTGDLIGNPFWAAAATRRAVSVFGYPNAVGLYLGPLTLLFVGWLGYARTACQAPKKNKLTIALSVLLSFLAIIFAKSSGALLGIAAGLVVVGLFASRKSRIATGLIVMLVVVACAATPLTRHAVWEKISLQDFSGTVRRIGWRDSWKMLSDGRLVFGAGLANFQNAVRPYHQEGFFVPDGSPDFYERLKTDAVLRARTWQPLEIYLYPHNIFLNFWSELGLAGMLLFIWVIGKYFYIGFWCQVSRLASTSERESRRAGYRYLVLGLIGAMVTIIVHGLVDVPYFKNDLAAMFWLSVAMLSLVDLSANNAKIKQLN